MGIFDLLPAGWGYNVGTVQLVLTLLVAGVDLYVVFWKLLPIVYPLSREEAFTAGRELKLWFRKKGSREPEDPDERRPRTGVVTVSGGVRRESPSSAEWEKSRTRKPPG